MSRCLCRIPAKIPLKNHSGFISYDFRTQHFGRDIGNGISAWWFYVDRVIGLVHMYDLMVNVDFGRAMVYLNRLRQMSNVFLNNRDDKRTGGFPTNLDQSMPAPYDPYHGRVMPAWGSVAQPDVGGWNRTWMSQVDMSAMFTYAMAAFARRVAEHPDWFCIQDRQDAIRFTTAVLETYDAFRQDMSFYAPNNPDEGYYHEVNYPNDGYPWNVTLSAVKPMVEIATAADSDLYRSSSDGQANSWGIYLATAEAPRFIARNVKYFLDDVQRCDQNTQGENSDCAKLDNGTTPWYWWRYRKTGFTNSNGDKEAQWPEDLSHSDWTFDALRLIWENRVVIDGLLGRNGYSERVALDYPGHLNSTVLGGIVNTFL
jgi:hypothetical protein